MLAVEKRLISWCKQHKFLLFFVVISGIAGVMRLKLYGAESVDYTAWLMPWYEEITSNGRLSAVRTQVGDYNVLYQLLIALLSYLPIRPLTLYKGLSIVFDYLLALCAAVLVYEICRKKVKAMLAYTFTLLCPSVWINSAYWAQCDSIYCFFLLATLLCIIKHKPCLTFVFYAFAFQFKFQSIFFLPFLMYYYVCSEEFSILHFSIVPAISVVICLLCGRHPFETFYIYAAQTGTWPGMVHNFSSIWNLISNNSVYFTSAAILMTVALLGIGLFILLDRNVRFNLQNIFTVSIWSVWTCLLFLPSLHERYGYFLTILLLVSAVLNDRLIGYAVVCELLTVISYARFLFNMGDLLPSQSFCSILYVLVYILFIYQNFILKKNWLSDSHDSICRKA